MFALSGREGLVAIVVQWRCGQAGRDSRWKHYNPIRYLEIIDFCKDRWKSKKEFFKLQIVVILFIFGIVTMHLGKHFINWILRGIPIVTNDHP